VVCLQGGRSRLLIISDPLCLPPTGKSARSFSDQERRGIRFLCCAAGLPFLPHAA